MERIWHVQLLGGLRALQGDRAVTRFGSQNAGILFAYLSLFLNRSRTREELADLLWPEADSTTGRVNLRTVLSSLRRELEGQELPKGSVLVTPGHVEVRLDGTAITTDVSRFEALLKTAARPSTPLNEQIRLLTDAMTLYRGPLLPGFYQNWALTERERLATGYTRALSCLSAAHERLGDMAAALVCARDAVTADPTSESVQANLIRLLAASGDRIAALRQYQEMERLLAEQLDTAPASEVRALVEALKDSHSTQAAPARLKQGAALSSRPAKGVATLLAKQSPDVTSQTTGARPNPIPSPLSGSRGLPPRFTAFFGRETEIAALSEALCASGTRLTTVTGPGGSGKTRLAAETVRTLGHRFSGGILFCPLAEIRASEHLAGAIAATIGMTIAPGVPPLEQVAAALNDSTGPVLLVLDNFEQLVEVGGVDAVRIMLSEAPSITLLITSRQRLLLEAEREFPLSPLPVPDFPGTPERLMEFSSVQLFVNRAQSSRSDFQITSRNGEAVARLCSRLEGIPLAIELAAAWSQTLTPAQMVERLGHRLDWLVARHRDIPGRHATLRAAVAWSWELLPEDLRRFFARLSVFTGGWTIEAAEKVCEEPDALQFLAELRDRSLVISKEDEAGTMRCRLLETLREFASEQMDEAERASLRQRHADYFLQRAEENSPHLGGPRPQHRRLNYLQAEHQNLRAALEWTHSVVLDEPASNTLTLHLRLCSALWDLWFLRGHLVDAQRWLLGDDIVGVLEASSAVPPLVLAAYCHSRAEAAHVWGEQESFAAAMEQALILYRRAGDQAGEGRVLARQARYASGISYPERRRMARLARRLCRDTGDLWAQAEVLADQAWLVRVRANQYRRAHRMMARAVDFYRASGDDEHVVAALRERGTWYAWSCEFDNASKLLGEALCLARRHNNLREMGLLLWGLGYNSAFSGQLDCAGEQLSEGAQIARTIGDSFCLVLNLTHLGLVLLGMGQDEAAEAAFRESIPRCRRLCEGCQYTLAELHLCYEGMALIAGRAGDLRRAARLLGAAWAMGRPGPDDTKLPPQPAAVQERYIRVRGVLKNAEADFRADWEWGRALQPEQADSFALDSSGAP